MNRLSIAVISFLFLGMNLSSTGQNCKTELDLGTDLMSRYVWRGTQFGGNSPSIQPYISLGWKGLELGAWGAYSLGGANTDQEFDLYLGYTFLKEQFTLTLTDYYFPAEGDDYNYFGFAANTTGHILEGSIGFNGNDKIPFGLMFAMNFWGADAIRVVNDAASADFNMKAGLQYSSYAELSYSHDLSENSSLEAFLGVNLTTPLAADTLTGYLGETGFYGSKAGVVNLGCTLSKEIRFTDDFALPVSASLITNPLDKKVYFVFGISL